MLYILPVFKINCIANYRKKRGAGSKLIRVLGSFFSQKNTRGYETSRSLQKSNKGNTAQKDVSKIDGL